MAGVRGDSEVQCGDGEGQLCGSWGGGRALELMENVE